MPRSIPVLGISDLSVAYRQRKLWYKAVRDFSLNIAAGQIYGLVGESGSGKSTVALAVMRYLSENGRVTSGEIRLDGRNLLDLSRMEMRQIWGNKINLVPQDPYSSLNPSIRIGKQVAEILSRHSSLTQNQALEEVPKLLERVHIADPERVTQSYPHQISGGMQQRVLIAMAISTEPALLVLDEPTTGLDVTTQAAVLDLFRELITNRRTATLYVTHNLGVVSRICQRVAVLYAGELVEDAPVDTLFSDPWHPYSRGLLDSVPKLGDRKGQMTLSAIRGRIPSLSEKPAGCVFAARCLVAIERCHVERPPLESPHSDRSIRCFRWQEIASGSLSTRPQESVKELVLRAPIKSLRPGNTQQTLLSIENLVVQFDLNRSFSEVIARKSPRALRAVNDVSLALPQGMSLGIVGESGSGKTTLARSVVGLASPADGTIELLGLSLPPTLKQRPLELRKLVQMVFQNPEEALNPYLLIGDSLQRPFITLLGMSRADAEAEVAKLLQAVRLPVEYAGRLPGQLSGGEKQRVAIARAFSTVPELLIADEPVSSLDVSVQASILNLLGELQAEHNNTMVFVSHNLAVVSYVADIIAVMYIGQIMELASSDQLFRPPYHPYTEALLAAVPTISLNEKRDLLPLRGEIPSQLDILQGCPFHTRCPRTRGELCETQRPPWQRFRDGGGILCHIPIDELLTVQSPRFADE